MMALLTQFVDRTTRDGLAPTDNGILLPGTLSTMLVRTTIATVKSTSTLVW